MAEDVPTRDTIPMYAMLDVWMALGLGHDVNEFELYYGEHGYALTWANLLNAVRGPQMPCAEPLGNGIWCVFEEGHTGPHYGPDDVGRPNGSSRWARPIAGTHTKNTTEYGIDIDDSCGDDW